jgi:uncharacterized coiled-coil protein SlyX
MSDPTPARPVPYLLAELLGEHLVRLEKLERRVAHQGETIKRLVNENGILNAKLSRLQRPVPARSSAPRSRQVADPAVEPARTAGPDFTGSLRELRGVSRQAN